MYSNHSDSLRRENSSRLQMHSIIFILFSFFSLLVYVFLFSFWFYHMNSNCIALTTDVLILFIRMHSCNLNDSRIWPNEQMSFFSKKEEKNDGKKKSKVSSCTLSVKWISLLLAVVVTPSMLNLNIWLNFIWSQMECIPLSKS